MNIFISNLSFRINDEDLRQLFEEYGEISSAKVITDKYTGKSRGFGFVEMSNEDSAKKAIEELDKAEYDGKVISVSIARPKTETRPSNGGGGRSFGGGGDRSRGGDRDRNYGKKW
jgi:RNA recognition motif-containing protein